MTTRCGCHVCTAHTNTLERWYWALIYRAILNQAVQP